MLDLYWLYISAKKALLNSLALTLIAINIQDYAYASPLQLTEYFAIISTFETSTNKSHILNSNRNSVWQAKGKEILHKIAGDDFNSFFGCSPKLKIIDSDIPSAVYANCESIELTSGLIDLLKKPEEFAFLIAHEAAHNILGHLNNVDHKCDLSNEIEADKLAISIMIQLGYSTKELPKLLLRLESFNLNGNFLTLGQLYPSLINRRLALEELVISRA